jgi:NADH-quinone oxidoreductase subunit M
MPELHFPWLEMSVLIPLIGGAWVGLIRDRDKARRHCAVICFLAMLCTIGEWFDFTSLHTYEAHDSFDLLEQLFGHDVFVVDELSAPLLPLAGLLYLLTVVTTQRTKINRFSFGWTR